MPHGGSGEGLLNPSIHLDAVLAKLNTQTSFGIWCTIK